MFQAKSAQMSSVHYWHNVGMPNEDRVQSPALKAPLLTVRDVSKILNMSQRNLYRYIQNGTIPVLRIGKCWRFSPAAIEQFIAQARFIPTPPPAPKKRPRK